MRPDIKSLWLIPFLCFGGGYFITRGFLQQTIVAIPPLIGKPADAALILLSEKNLNPRIIGIVDEPDLKPGTVLNQIPRADAQARPHQTVFLVLSSRPAEQKAMLWIGMMQKNIELNCAEQKLKPFCIKLPHQLPLGQCFAQFPNPDTPLTDSPVLYISAGTNQKYIWPSLIGAPASDVLEALKKQGITATIIGEHATASQQELNKLRILDQRPLPGSFLQYEGMHKPSIHIRLGR